MNLNIFKFGNKLKLPVYQAQIDPDQASDLGVNYIGLVDRPAIERDFQAFNAHAKKESIDKRLSALEGNIKAMALTATSSFNQNAVHAKSVQRLAALKQRIKRNDQIINGFFEWLEKINDESNSRPLNNAEKERLLKAESKERRFISMGNALHSFKKQK